MKAGGDVDIGQIHFFIGPLEVGLYVGRSGLLRQGRNDFLHDRLAGRPDDNLRQRDRFRQSDWFWQIGLNECLRAGLGLRHGTRDRRARSRVAGRSGRVWPWMRGGIGNEVAHSLHLLLIQVELAHRITLCDHPGRGWLVGEAEEDEGRRHGMHDDRGGEGSGPRPEVVLLRKECNRLRSHDLR